MGYVGVLTIAFYLLGVFFTVMLGWFYIDGAATSKHRFGARLILLSPLWPALAVHAIGGVLRDIWRLADFKTGRKK